MLEFLPRCRCVALLCMYPTGQRAQGKIVQELMGSSYELQLSELGKCWMSEEKPAPANGAAKEQLGPGL